MSELKDLISEAKKIHNANDPEYIMADLAEKSIEELNAANDELADINHKLYEDGEARIAELEEQLKTRTRRHHEIDLDIMKENEELKAQSELDDKEIDLQLFHNECLKTQNEKLKLDNKYYLDLLIKVRKDGRCPSQNEISTLMGDCPREIIG